jgi:hypothetical protein
MSSASARPAACKARALKQAARLVQRRSGGSSELEKFFGCRIEFGADTDEIIFDRKVGQFRLVGADPYLYEILLHHCEQALAHRRSIAGLLRIAIENAIIPLLPSCPAFRFRSRVSFKLSYIVEAIET